MVLHHLVVQILTPLKPVRLRYRASCVANSLKVYFPFLLLIYYGSSPSFV